ncbi:MAG: glutaredoxin family protein [Candidatus Zambryskibacteria bacterium]|nr:glutaredoxin family protein [Candidatus Zambryskibacteria bacterium]
MNEKQKSVIIYSTPTCHFCHMAKGFFDERGIKYTDYDVLADTEKRQEMIKKSGQMGVPVILIDDEIIIGFDQARISLLLGI